MSEQVNETTRESGLSATDCAALSSAPHSPCDCTDVAAYLDGELSIAESASFERHIASCRACALALAEQRRLLCLLDAAFSRVHKRVELPEEFVRVVKARAQTDMTSARHASEGRRAALVVATLFLIACALLGGRIFAVGLTPLRAAAGAVLSISGMIFHTFSEAAAGLLFILRSVGRYLATEPRGGGTLVLLLLACALAALLRLVSDYHRERLTD